MTRRTILLALIPAALLAQPQGNAVVGGTTDEAIPRLQVAGSDGTLVIRKIGSQLTTTLLSTTTLLPQMLCLTVNPMRCSMLYDGPVTGITTLVIRGGGQHHGSSPLMECRDSKCREVKPSKLSRLWRKLKMKGTK